MREPDLAETGPAECAPPQAEAPPWLYRLCIGVMLALAGLLVYASMRASYVAYLQAGHPGVDFDYFWHAGQYFREHGGLPPADQIPGALPWYLPFTTRACILLALLPLGVTTAIWAVGNVALLGWVARYVGRRMVELPPHDWPVHQLPPLLLIGLWLAVQTIWNQLSIVVLAGSVACFALFVRRRCFAAGVVLGLTCLLKLMPAILLLWFVLKRGWRTVAAAVLTIVLFGPGWDLVSFGPEKTVEYYGRWWENAVRKGGAAYMIRTGYEADFRNQGLGVVLRHWLMSGNCARQMWFDQRYPLHDERWGINVADLPARSVVWIYRVIALGSLAGFLWLTRRPAERLPPRALRLEFAAGLCAMCWFAPVMRMYHLVLLYPALALLLPSALSRSARGSVGRKTAAAGVLIYAICYLLSFWGILSLAAGKPAGTNFWFDAAGFGLGSALAAGTTCLLASRQELRSAVEKETA